MKRGRPQIIIDILKAAAEYGERGEVRGPIMGYAGINNHKQAKKYLDIVLDANLLERVETGGKVRYKVTPDGFRLLESSKPLIEAVEEMRTKNL